MAIFPQQFGVGGATGSPNTWGTELRDFFSPTFNLATGKLLTLLFDVDNATDIGASGASRPRDCYLGRNLQAAGAGPHLFGTQGSVEPALKFATLDASKRFSLHVQAATFEGVRDDVCYLAYNVSGSGREILGEHALKVQLESRFKSSPTGPEIAEWNFDYISADGTISRRPFGIGIHLTGANANLTMSIDFASELVTFYNSARTLTPLIVEPTGVTMNKIKIPAAGLQLDGQSAATGAAILRLMGSFPERFALLIDATITGAAGVASHGLSVQPTISPAAGSEGFGVAVAATLNKATSGTHPTFAALRLMAPPIGVGAATVTKAAVLWVNGAVSGGLANFGILLDGDHATPFAISKSTVAVGAPGAGFGLLRWEAGTNAGTLKLVGYAGTSTTGVTIIDNVGAGN